MLPLVVFAQRSREADSLHAALAGARHDTTRAQTLKKIAWHYYFSEPAKAPAYALQMIEVSERSGYVKGVWDGHNIMGVIYCTSQRYDSAIVWLTKALSLPNDKKYYSERLYSLQWMATAYQRKGYFEKAHVYGRMQLKTAKLSNDPVKLSKAYKNVAGLFYDRGQYEQALTHYLKADSLMDEAINIDRGEILQNIGQIYHVLENLTLEKKYLSDALAVYEKLNDDYGMSVVSISLGNMELQGKNYKKAEAHFLDAISFFDHYNDDKILGNIYRLLGTTYFHLTDYKKSLAHYEKAIGKMDGNAGDQDLIYCYRGMGNVYIALSDYPKALAALNTATQKAQALGDLSSSADILQSFTALYHKKGDYKTAFETQQRYQSLADSVSKIKSSKVIAEAEARHQNEKKQQQIALLAAQNQLQQQEKDEQRTLFIMAIAGALMLTVIFYVLFIAKQKANRKLKALDELKSRFFANISHEFRTPLTLISGPVENRLRSRELDSTERAEFEMIGRNSQQLLTLVDQLLDLSRIESGSMVLRIENGNIAVLLKTLASSFRYLASSKHIAYTISVSDSVQDGWYDRDVLQKIVTNLLSNAFKYTPEEGEIVLAAETIARKLVITVSNSGEGIREQDKERIFDRFYQVNGSAGGIGIGLALLKELVDLTGGALEVTSTPGQLTTFRVTLAVEKENYPNAVVRENLSSSPGPDLQSTPLRSETTRTNGAAVLSDAPDALPILLVVEDNTDVRTYIKSILHKEYQILEAADGHEGITLALEHVPDLIISDVMMPDTDGLALCRQLKTDERTSHIPIILLTAKAGAEHALTGFETGADDYITKPFSSDLLIVRIRKLIELRRKLHERYSQEVVLKPKDIVLPSTDKLFLEKVQQILDKYLSDADFNMETFAFEVGMSRMQLHRKLKGLTGLSASAFIRSHRLSMAAELLARADANISEIGYSVGFSDPSYFAKCFRETFHCTPTEFAAKNQALGIRD